MPLSTIVHAKCPTCNKTAVEKSRIDFSDTVLVTLECGHVIFDKRVTSGAYETVVSSDNCKLMPYQIDGVKFVEQSGARCLIADEQGLGKMVMSQAVLKLHPELLPAVFVTKTTIKHQTHNETRRWCGVDGYLCQVINSGKERALPGFNVYVITYDLAKIEGMFDLVNYKTLIIDECQAIKNHLADRSKAVQKLAKRAEHIIATSGTPIKNNAGEYFTILNLLQPSRFPTYQGYIDKYCDAYSNGYGYKVGGLSNPELFQEATKDFIIRRTKAEVLPDLPALSRKFYHVELDRKMNKAYAAALDELDELYYADEGENTMTNMLAIMSKLRRITGISKVTECVDFVTEHLLSTDRKIVVFLHHHDAHTLLTANLNKWCDDGGYTRPLNLTSSLDANARAELVEKFKTDNHRIMIASTLAAGEGLNLQFCSDAVMLERQWNPANEEQAEGRFHRFGQLNPVSITYMIASETIDEYFTELVEQKRSYVASALDGKEIEWDQNSLMKDLANILVTKGRKKWSL